MREGQKKGQEDRHTDCRGDENDNSPLGKTIFGQGFLRCLFIYCVVLEMELRTLLSKHSELHPQILFCFVFETGLPKKPSLG
jgi:hypothetical protein